MSGKAPCTPDKLPIETLDWSRLIEPISQAERELGRFDGTLNGIINPELLLSPLMVNEAVLSSKIEGTQVSLTEALEYEAGKQQDDEKQSEIREVLNYRGALQDAQGSLGENKRISFRLVRQLHKRLMQDVRGGDQNPGQFRTVQNWIGKPGMPIEEARFIPPAPTRINKYLDNWRKFMNGDYQSPLVQLALIHAQFEIIHPFGDGNGRLGRMLIPLFMYQKKILQRPVFYISEYMEKHNRRSRNRLLAITEDGDWMGWICFFLEAIEEQAYQNNDKAVKIHGLYRQMKEKFFKATQSKFAQSALDAFFKKPILSSIQFRELTDIPTKATASSILKKLCKAELIDLSSRGAGRRPAAYACSQLIEITEGGSD